MATPKKVSDRISYVSQQSGEYYIYVDGKFECSSDNFRELQEDIKEIEDRLYDQEKAKEKEDTN